MNLKHPKPKNFIVLIFCILMHVNTITLFAQEEPPRNNGAEYEPPPVVNNMAQCGANGTNYNCPVVLQGLTKPAPPVPNVYTVTNAQELYELLSCFYQDWQVNGFPTSDPNRCFTTLIPPISCSGIIPTCSTKVIIHIASGAVIDFRDPVLFPPSIFPIEVAPGIEIIGTFDLGNVSYGISQGTRIYFPYLYEAGTENTVDRRYLYKPNASCNNDPAFVFKLNSGAAIKNVCLAGPKTDIKDWRWGFVLKDFCQSGSALPTHEGVAGGILIQGNKCEVSGCEIYGFPSFGILVRDMVLPLLTNRAFDWGQCYDFKNPNDKGSATIANNYIHDCKAYGIYVCNLVYKNSSAIYALPTEEAFITNNIFENNQCNVAYSGKNIKLSLTYNTYN